MMVQWTTEYCIVSVCQFLKGHYTVQFLHKKEGRSNASGYIPISFLAGFPKSYVQNSKAPFEYHYHLVK
jgi:hypothetical protein